jgi:hypothetical protein
LHSTDEKLNYTKLKSQEDEWGFSRVKKMEGKTVSYEHVSCHFI